MNGNPTLAVDSRRGEKKGLDKARSRAKAVWLDVSGYRRAAQVLGLEVQEKALQFLRGPCLWVVHQSAVETASIPAWISLSAKP